MNKLARLLALAAVSATAAVSSRAGTFADITLDGNTSDWSAISAAATNTGSGPLDQIFVANNDTHLFLLLTFNTSVNILTDGFRMNIDSDANTNTGFNTYGLGQIGSELLYEGESAYQQALGNYNTGATTNAPLLITNYTQSVTSVELGISRSALSDTVNGTLVFPGSSINLAVYFESFGDSSFTGPVGYTFATAGIPEPSTFAALAGLGALGLAAIRRRR